MPPRINGSTARSSIKRAIERTTTTTTKTSRRPAIIEQDFLRNSILSTTTLLSSSSRQYATTATTSGAGPIPQIPLGSLRLPDDYIPPTQPPSARRPDTRKSQLLRSYTALLRSTPLILFFQHNNLTAPEFAAIRRELRAALATTSGSDTTTDSDPIAEAIQLQVLRTRIFDVALKITEFFDPGAAAAQSNAYTHDLSASAYEAIKKAQPQQDGNSSTSSSSSSSSSSVYSEIAPLLVGPVAAVTFPAVSPAHLAAVLKILAPSTAAGFPAPTRRKNPGYYDITAQSGLQKLLLVGGRIEGKVFDQEGVRWVGGIGGGIDGLRAQLVAMLQSAGLGLTTALEGHSKGLWLALEGRRTQLEDEADGGKKETESGKETEAGVESSS